MSELIGLGLIQPNIYLREPWKNEIPSSKEISWTYNNLDSFGARLVNFERYKHQENVALLWCIKHEWGIKIPELSSEKFKKFESRGLVLQQRLRLCIQIHPYYPSGYRNAAHWFANILRDSDQINGEYFFNQPEQSRGNKKSDIQNHRENLLALKCGENTCDKEKLPNLSHLIDLAILHGHKDSQQKLKPIADTWKAYLKAYSAHITFQDRSGNYGDFYISDNKLMIQRGKGSAQYPFLPKAVEQFSLHEEFHKMILADVTEPDQRILSKTFIQ